MITSIHFNVFSIDATLDDGKLARLVNDAKGNSLENCTMKIIKVNNRKALCLFARRCIEAGEELRYDYGVDDLPWRVKVSAFIF